MSKINIAIDGYSSCGKSTLAKALAKKLHYVYIDSGAMYRAVTLYALQNGLIVDELPDTPRLIEALDGIDIHLERRGGEMVTILNGRDVGEEIRTMAVNAQVSNVSTIREVRQLLQRMQHRLSGKKGVVMDGRDIGTVVLPEAELKIFMTANIEERTRRRFLELEAKGLTLTMEEVRNNLTERDHKDTHRKENPLTKAADAKILDTTDLTPEEQLKVAFDWVQIELKKKN